MAPRLVLGTWGAILQPTSTQSRVWAGPVLHLAPGLLLGPRGEAGTFPSCSSA